MQMPHSHSPKAKRKRLLCALAFALAAAHALTAAEGEPEAPLCATRWGQSQPYNLLCPEVGGRLAPAGCTAVAMAQIMAAHQWPQQSAASGSPFAWSDMLPTYAEGGYTDEQALAVAWLMRACGDASNTRYGAYASTAYLHDAGAGLISDMDYSREMRLLKREWLDSEEWEAAIRDELAAGRPVLMRGVDPDTGMGHAFVCDGYAGEGFVHINWGYDGVGDGYYPLADLGTNAHGHFTASQAMLTHIKPHGGGKLWTAMEQTAEAALCQPLYMRQPGELVEIACGLYSCTLAEACITPGIMVVCAADTAYIEADAPEWVEYGWGWSTISVIADALPEGDCLLWPAFRSADGQWLLPYMATPVRAAVDAESVRAANAGAAPAVKADADAQASSCDLLGRPALREMRGLTIGPGGEKLWR